MSKEIKSIKFKQVRIIETEPNAKISDHGKFFAVQKEGSEIPDYWVGKEYVDSIKYKTPKLLKRADGSLISEPKEGTKVIGIFHCKGGLETYTDTFTKIMLTALRLGNTYLPEDRELAEKKAKMLTKQLEITVEIDRLNAEQQFIIDKNDYSKYQYYLNTDESGTVTYFAYHPKTPKNTQLLSAETTKTILAKYSQDELKQYLGIII